MIETFADDGLILTRGRIAKLTLNQPARRNAMTEAGLAACAQADWAMYAPTVAAALNLPAGLQLACGIAIGHADPARPINAVRTTRDDPLSLP